LDLVRAKGPAYFEKKLTELQGLLFGVIPAGVQALSSACNLGWVG
jgi:hypothetical protein